MSGGQKQRIVIVWAIIKKPQNFLLDEAISTLDSESKRVVQEALDKAVVGRTTIIIAYCLSTIKKMDVIAIVQNRKVMEMGSHDELIKNDNGLYTSLVHLQQTEKSKGQDDTIPNPNSISNRDINSSSSCRLSLVSHSSFANSIALSRALLGDEEVDDVVWEEKKFPIPSFRRLLLLNLPEWKQASLGCLSVVLFGAVQSVYSFIMGSMISVYFLTDHDEIKKKIIIYALCFLGLVVFSLVIHSLLTSCQ